MLLVGSLALLRLSTPPWLAARLFGWRWISRRLAPEAHRLATSLRREPDAWQFDGCRGTHTHLASGIVLRSCAGIIEIVTRRGAWRPTGLGYCLLSEALDSVPRRLIADLAPTYLDDGDRARLARIAPPAVIEHIAQHR